MSTSPVTTEEIWELLSGKLRSFFLQQISDQALADDLLQETFIRIHRGVDSLKDQERTSAWVFRIARNVLVDHFRRKNFMEPLWHEPQISDEDQDETNMNEQVGDWLRPMLSTLPENYREAVELFELQDVSQQDIADRLGLSLSGAKSRVQRGRQKLKDSLLQCCHFEFDRRGNIIDFEPRSSSCACCMDDCSGN